VNLIAPFILISQLKSVMLKRNSQGSPKFIVNVSSMEGQFAGVKSPKHPHTNVAKAGLNMLTRTCAYEFAQQNIFINSVDTGSNPKSMIYENSIRMDYEIGAYSSSS
jgi:NAD(P)-dependent dehydrogenase (short-subunit alcohol dehydrogenase family)